MREKSQRIVVQVLPSDDTREKIGDKNSSTPNNKAEMGLKRYGHAHKRGGPISFCNMKKVHVVFSWVLGTLNMAGAVTLSFLSLGRFELNLIPL